MIVIIIYLIIKVLSYIVLQLAQSTMSHETTRDTNRNLKISTTRTGGTSCHNFRSFCATNSWAPFPLPVAWIDDFANVLKVSMCPC